MLATLEVMTQAGRRETWNATTEEVDDEETSYRIVLGPGAGSSGQRMGQPMIGQRPGPRPRGSVLDPVPPYDIVV